MTVNICLLFNSFLKNLQDTVGFFKAQNHKKMENRSGYNSIKILKARKQMEEQ